MKTLFALCLSFFTPLFADISPVVEERDHLFILATLSYLYNRLEVRPKPGWDIAALIAWDVENVDSTPEFVIGRNRNFEKQGNIFHAEIMAIEQAALKKKSIPDSSKTVEEFHRQNSLKLKNATLYSSLEPCPFCRLGITSARIPKIIYFMDDPTTRDKTSYEPIALPNEFCGRFLTKAHSSTLDLAIETNRELKELLSSIDFALYFKERLEPILKLAYELFHSYEIKYEQNRELYQNLFEAVK